MTHRMLPLIGRLLLLFAFPGMSVPVAGDGLGGKEMAYSELPAASVGSQGMDAPDYEGVDQLLVLSDRWVIVVFNDMQRLYEEIDRLADGELAEQQQQWEASETTDRKNWLAYKARFKIRDDHITEARVNTGELAYSKPASFEIISETDSAYSGTVAPKRAARLLVSHGAARDTGDVFPIDFSNYVYLELPSPMKDGNRYTIAHSDGRKVTFRYDLKRTVSRTIKVNQLGYLSEGPDKIAYLGGHLYEFGPLKLDHVQTFDVISVETGEVVHSGKPTLRAKDPRWKPRGNHDFADRPSMYGEDIYELSFGAVTQPGWYFLSVPGVGRSWPFRIGDDTYGELFYTAMRGIYHQRCTIELTQPYTAWHRDKCHDWPVYESDLVMLPMHETERPKNYNIFDIIGGSVDTTRETYPVPGGWHDAADWDRAESHYTVIFDLLGAYEARPEAFADSQLNLPESGNGIPDLLDEVAFGLQVWTASMDERGGVSGICETSTHPTMDDEEYKYSFSQRTRWNTLMYAAAASQLSRALRPHDEAEADKLLDLAKKAYTFGSDPKNSLGKFSMQAKTKRGKGEPYTVEFEEREDHIHPYLLHAKAQLYLTTNDKTYFEDIGPWAYEAHAPAEWRFNLNDFSPWIYASLVECEDALPADLVAKWRSYLTKKADDYVGYTGEMPYRTAWPTDTPFHMAWGNAHGTNINRLFLIAYKDTGDKKYRNAAIYNVDAMLGANAQGMSWTTGVGYVYPIDIQHAPSTFDQIMDPVPGVTVYGNTGGPIFYLFRQQVWESPKGDAMMDFTTPAQRHVPLYRRFMTHPGSNTAMNEFTVATTQAGMAMSAAMLMPESGWMPSEENKNRMPRRESLLFGRYYLP